MDSTANHGLTIALRQMIKYCKDIQELLKNDQNHFSKDEISAIEQSNHQKSILLAQLSNLLNDLNDNALKNKSGHFFTAIEALATAEMDDTGQRELTSAVNELKSELASCYESLIINSKVIYTNLQQLKMLWNNLLTCRSEMNFVYDAKGNTK